jgi:predicted TIM-barrel fold metal-dependent hydrolase
MNLVPPGACDCHIHVYDSRYPAAPQATLRPPDVSVADYRALQAGLGTSRVVVVTPSTYGTDNRPTLDALAAFGDSARGIAVVGEAATDAELHALHAAGVRGLRLNLAAQGGDRSLESMERLCARAAPLGWHLQLFGSADLWPALAPRLRALPVQLVFDHFGNVPAAAGVHHPGFSTVAQLVREGRAWVKLSAPMNVSAEATPHADVAPMARGYLAAGARRMLWGTDWPHPSLTHKPDDAAALRQLLQWCDDAATAEDVLVRNPARLYGFGSGEGHGPSD